MTQLLIPSEDIPQADVLGDVVRTVEAVRGGADTYQEIADHLGKVERQGRYYRRAAEILGFIENRSNNSHLTTAGTRLLNASAAAQRQLLRQAVLQSSLFQRVVTFLEQWPGGVSRSELENFLVQVTEPVGESMMHRRVSTVTTWLGAVGLLRQTPAGYVLAADVPNLIRTIEFTDVSEPMLPSAPDLQEYQTVGERSAAAARAITVLIDLAALERANDAHQDLVDLVAGRIRAAGGIPRANQLIDLATRIADRAFIFEMKSLTPSNARRQLRRGLSQLYEYRYLQNIPDATLVLVVETPLPAEVAWMQSYLENDRQVRLIWREEDGLREIHGPDDALAFLNDPGVVRV